MTYFSQKGFDTKRPSLKQYEENIQGNNKRVFFLVSPNNVPTLKGSYGKCKGRCLIRVLTLGRGILPVNFRNKSGAFRLRRLAQSARLRSGLILVCGVLLVNFSKTWLLWNLDMHFDCAGSHTKCSSAFWAHFGLRHFTCKFCIKWPVWNLDMRFDCLAKFDMRFDCAGSRLAQSVSLRCTSCLLLSRLFVSCCQSHLRDMLFRLKVPLEQWSHAWTNSQNRIYLQKVVWNVAVNKQTHL